MQLSRRQLAAGILGAGVVLPAIDLSGVALAEPAGPTTPAPLLPPDVDELYQPAGLLDTALSPDGGLIASLREMRETIDNPKPAKGEGKTKIKRTAYVAITKSSDLDGKATYVRIGDYDVEQVEWASETRLLIWVKILKVSGIWIGDTFFPIPVRRVISVGIDGDAPVVLFGAQSNTVKREFDLGNVVDRLTREDNYVLMQKWETGKSRYGLWRVNILTGEAQLFELGEKATDGWYLQDGVPVLRFDSNLRGTTYSVYGRAPGDEKWKLIRKTRRNELQRYADIDVVAATPEPGVLMISHRADSEEFASIKLFDVRTLQMGATVKSAPDADVIGAVVDEMDRLVAVSWKGDRQGYNFEDSVLAGHFKGINKYYNEECSVRLFDISRDHNHVIFHVTGPRQPGQFVYYDLKARHLTVLGDQYEHLPPERLARMETLTIACRDGAKITAFLSHPLGEAKNRPMIVMPHGGPEVRDYYDYNPWIQALCARGWLVLQPNFRGSGGYGKAFGDAGRRRWGTRMQEDVEDAVAQVVASGLVDPSRLAVMGASYGGYAAMMGVVRQPTLYRCAVAISGDFDLMQSLDFTRKEDGSDSDTYAYWVASMGDPKADKEMLAAHSPRQRVNEIQVPVMMLHGTEDNIVSPDQSRQMAKALAKAGKTYEHIEFPGEGHSGWSDEDEKKMLNYAIVFISKAFA